jgi:hypothetical protein
MSNNFECMTQRLQSLSDTDREQIRRVLTGEADSDLIEREAINSTIRDLRVSKASLASREYQMALGDVQRAIAKLPFTPTIQELPHAE